MHAFPIEAAMERRFRQYTDSLDDETLRNIGQLMASTSLIDHLLRVALGVARGLDLKATRETLGWMQWEQALHELRLHLDAAGIVIEGADFPALKRELRRLHKLRDLVGHCVWVEGTDGKPLIAQTQGGRSDAQGTRSAIPEGADIAERLHRAARDARFAADEAQRICQWLEEHDGRWARPPQAESDRGSFGMTATSSALEVRSILGPKA